MPDEKKKERAKRIVTQMQSLIDAAERDRTQWNAEAKKWFGYYICDPTVVFGKQVESDPTLGAKMRGQATYHNPMVPQLIEALVAALNGRDIEIRYIPKIDQDLGSAQPDMAIPVGELTRMGNAAFDACRGLIDWNSHMHTMVKEVAIFDRAYIANCIDYRTNFPDPLPTIKSYNAWQVFHTPGLRFSQAPEIVTVTWVDREELRAQYPEFSDDIDELETAGDSRKAKEDGAFSGSVRVIDTGTPGYGDQEATVHDNAVKVMERWRFDASLSEKSHKADEAEMAAEHMMLEDYVAHGGDLPLPQLMFSDYQYHREHNVGHAEKAQEFLQRAAEMKTVQGKNEFGIVSVRREYVMEEGRRARAEQAAEVLLQHIEDYHEDAMEDIPPEREGYYPKYEGGWRQTCILGEELLVYDGASIMYKEFGIQGPPIDEFWLMGHPLHHWGPSLVGLMVDYNKIVDSTMNAVIDNARMFGNHKRWVKSKVKDDDEYHCTNNPYEEDVFPDDTQFGMDFGEWTAKEAPQSSFNLIGMAESLAAEVASVTPTLQGRQESGVRSGTQQQTMLTQGMNQLTYKMTRLKPAIERVATRWFKMILKHPPEDQFVAPIVDGQAIPIDFDTLKNIDFVIEVVIHPGGTSSVEERANITLGFLQNYAQIFAGLGMTDIAIEFLARSIKYSDPDLANALETRLPQIRQQQAQAQANAQAAAQAEIAQNQAPPR